MYLSHLVYKMSVVIVKEAFIILAPQVTFMMNLSVRSTVFPSAWKEALVVPIPKRGISTLVQNYRLISLLPLLGKILEKLMHKQFSGYIEDGALLTSNQQGFRKEHSCIHSVAKFTEFADRKMDRGLLTLTTFINFRKAFDCVQHPTLIDNLTRLGVGPGVVKWFRSYLSGRKQRVLANGVYSSFLDVKQSVPQGSVLGPLFYILYANEIADCIGHCKIALYADDTVLYTASADFANSVRKIIEDVRALPSWCVNNGIRMNTDKTKVSLFGNTKKLLNFPSVNVNVEGTPLEVVSSYKYPGGHAR